MLFPRAHYLADYDGSRQNNFTAIRLTLAWMVIFAHSFALQPAAGMGNPASRLLQGSTTTGQMAVDGFFAISGFLVTASFLNRGLRDYLLSRVLRVIPGLAVCVALTVVVLGAVATSLPIADYFSSSATLRYLRNALALPGTIYTLPGVFSDNAHAGVNGSLWSIPYEMMCYVALTAAGVFGLLTRKAIANVLTLVVLLTLLYSYVNPEAFGLKQHVSSALLCFPLGVLLYLNRQFVRLDGRIAAVALVLLYWAFGETWFRYIYPFVWTYLLFFIAYRSRFINLDKAIGDVSYGIYIYAFPIQQTVAWLMPSGNPYTNMLLSTALVLPCAVLSWRAIEKPSLALKARLVG